MEGKQASLTAAEWQVMECLWQLGPQTGRAAADWLESRTGWSRSTTLTLLRRLAAKDAVKVSVQDGVKVFAPAVDREDAAVRETEDLLERVYQGSVSLLVSALTKKQSLSRQEIDALHALLDGLEEENDG